MENYQTFTEHHNCICHTVKKIIDAQNKVSSHGDCATNCEQSIKQILAPKKKNPNKHTTIPFILFSKDLTPFIAESIFKQKEKGSLNESFYKCITTPVLRAKKMVNKQQCCVVVELLRPVNAQGITVTDFGNHLADFFCTCDTCKIVDFQETGICLTLDLNCFCSIQCLDPITPSPPTTDCPPSCCCCQSCDCC